MGLHACRSNTTFATHHRVPAPPVRIGTTCTGNRRHTGRQEFLILHTRSQNAPITIPRECTRFSTYARHIPRLARLPGSLVSVSCSLQIGNCSASISSSFLFHPRSCHPPPLPSSSYTPPPPTISIVPRTRTCLTIGTSYPPR